MGKSYITWEDLMTELGRIRTEADLIYKTSVAAAKVRDAMHDRSEDEGAVLTVMSAYYKFVDTHLAELGQLISDLEALTTNGAPYECSPAWADDFISVSYDVNDGGSGEGLITAVCSTATAAPFQDFAPNDLIKITDAEDPLKNGTYIVTDGHSNGLYFRVAGVLPGKDLTGDTVVKFAKIYDASA